MTEDVDHWLAGLGLSAYAALFRANHIDADLLQRLSADDLKEIGVASLGHRKRILEAIAGAAGAAPSDAPDLAAPGLGRHRSPKAYTPRHLADKILQSRSALQGERKQVSVLFADVQGSMALAEQLDPEQWHQILEGFFAILTAGVHRFEGTVNQYTGDGIMALFGAPIAHEDHAQRACFAALHMQHEISRYAIEVKRAHGVGFSTRMGIHSGEVVVGRIGDDLRMDYTAQGHTVGLAQRMESLAEPNTCYLSAGTAALAGGYFALEDLGEFQVKGVAAAVQVHRLVGVGPARNRFDMSRQRGLAPFVGRAADLHLLDGALARSRAGSGQVVGVVAEAGTGKSRLCFEFLEQCRAAGLRVIEARAVAHGRNIPLLPVLDLFRSVFDIGARDDERAAREKIAGRVVLLDPALAEQLPMVFDFLGVGDLRLPLPLRDPEARQSQMLALFLRLTGGTTPTVTVIEDLHWLDDASAEFVDQLVDACSGTQQHLLLLNFRPGFHAPWMARPCYRSIALAPLDPGAMADLVTGLLGADPGLATLFADIHARTGGNPFFAEEIVQALIESGQLRGSRGAFRLDNGLARLEVPPSVQALLAARIDRLPEPEKQLLQVAAVIGKEFSEPLLAAVAGQSAAVLAAALDALQTAGFIHARALYPVAEYAFKHPLTHEVALGSQLRERRRQVHAAVAQAIEAQDPLRLDEHAALLAHHWDEAADALASAHWHRRAAEWPGCPDFVSAIHHWQRVRELLRSLPDDPGTFTTRLAACTRLLTLGQRVGVDGQASRALLDEGRALADLLGDQRAHVRLTMAYGWALVSTGDIASCLDMLSGILPQLDVIDDPELTSSAWGNLVLLNCFAARFALALDLVGQARRLPLLSAGAGKGLGSLNAAATLAQFEGYCLGWMGQMAPALDAFAASLQQADAVGELAVFARCHSAELHCYHRQAQHALDLAHQAEKISLALGAPAMLRARVQVALAYAHLAGGRAQDAVIAARAAVDIHRRVDRVHAGLSAQLLAEALLQAGDPDAALAAADEAIGLCRFSLRANYEAAAWGVRARALLRRDASDARDPARDALAQAAVLVERSGALLLAPVLAQWQAEWALVAGDPAQS